MSHYYFNVYGKVQKVMFRQTFIRGALKRGLVAAASNDKMDVSRVSCYIKGDKESCLDLLSSLESKMVLNSWGAKVERIEYLGKGQANLEDYQVSTENVEEFSWTEGVEFYL